MVDVLAGLAPGDVGDDAHLGRAGRVRKHERPQGGHQGRDPRTKRGVRADGVPDHSPCLPVVHDHEDRRKAGKS